LKDLFVNGTISATNGTIDRQFDLSTTDAAASVHGIEDSAHLKNLGSVAYELHNSGYRSYLEHRHDQAGPSMNLPDAKYGTTLRQA